MTKYTISDRAGHRYATGDLSPQANAELESAIIYNVDQVLFIGCENGDILKIRSSNIIALVEHVG